MTRLALALCLALAACGRVPSPGTGAARYTLGAPYQLGGLWSYPREDFGSVETGLAEVLPDTRAGRRTANGEVHDPTALVAAHRTLQLPAIVTVANLENGRVLKLRLNDRGPVRAGRVLGLSQRAAELLGVPRGGAAQVLVGVDPGPSRALAASLPADFERAPAVATAPAGSVTAEALAPLDGTRTGMARQAAAGPRRDAAALPVADSPPPGRLPEVVTQGAARPGRLVLEVGRFFRRDLAQRQAGRIADLGASVEAVGAGRDTQWRVRLGPYGTVAAADAAVARVLAAGLPEVRLAVE